MKASKVNGRSKLRVSFIDSCRQQLLSIPSLAEYLVRHPTHALDNLVHNRRVSQHDAREWGLARCGHHWFSDGRLARHSGHAHVCDFCHEAEGTLTHALGECPGFADIRQRWLSSLSLQSLPAEGHDLVQTLLTNPSVQSFGHFALNARFIASACRRMGAVVRSSAGAMAAPCQVAV